MVYTFLVMVLSDFLTILMIQEIIQHKKNYTNHTERVQEPWLTSTVSHLTTNKKQHIHTIPKSTNRMFMSAVLKCPHQVIKHKEDFTKMNVIVTCHITKFMALSLLQKIPSETGLLHNF